MTQLLNMKKNLMLQNVYVLSCISKIKEDYLYNHKLNLTCYPSGPFCLNKHHFKSKNKYRHSEKEKNEYMVPPAYIILHSVRMRKKKKSFQEYWWEGRL